MVDLDNVKLLDNVCMYVCVYYFLKWWLKFSFIHFIKKSNNINLKPNSFLKWQFLKYSPKYIFHKKLHQLNN